MTTGIIKTKTDKGFGFIAVEGSDDVFFHGSACAGQFDALEVGQTVQFDIEKGEKGLKAANVVAVKAGATSPQAESAAEAKPADAESDASIAA